MTRVMLLTFAVLSWAWFELSGGSDFTAGDNGVRLLVKMPDQPIVSTQSHVTRGDLGEAELTAFPDNGLTLKPLRVSAPLQVSSSATEAKIAPVVQPVVTEPVIEPVEIAAVQIDYRKVSGNRVNLRRGPNTSFDVVTQLLKGEEVEILEDRGDGWVRLRALDGNDTGWMSDGFLTASN